MGGSGGNLKSPLGDLAALEARAKKAIQNASDRPRRNVFISFAYEDLAEVNLLRGQARNKLAELEFNDWSLREPFGSKRAEYIRAGIRDRIRQSSITLVYVSDTTHRSKWVDWEIRESIAIGKRVVAMYGGATPPRSPPALVDHAVKLIPWSHDALMRALEGGREAPTRGGER